MSLTLALLLAAGLKAQQADLLYYNYVAALHNHSTFQYFLVIKVKDLNTGLTREYCTHGNFLWGALLFESEANPDSLKRYDMMEAVLANQERYFEFRSGRALLNISGHAPYSMEELAQLERRINFDALARRIRRRGEWSKEFMMESKAMRMYAHALSNRGILTGESSCYGGTLEYVKAD